MRTEVLDLDAYLARIGANGPLSADLATLNTLHGAHVCSVPFENLAVQLGQPVRLDLPSLWHKIVVLRRGGYCFEQNALFAAVLRQVGFQVTTLLARVRFRATELLPRTHMLLQIDLDGARWLADVGFGGYGLLEPLQLVANVEQTQAHDKYRLTEHGAEFQLEAMFEENFEPLYSFTLEESFPIDFEAANYYTSTHPASRFTQNLTVSRHAPDARYGLLNRAFSIRRATGTERRTLESDAEVYAVLARYFDLAVEPGQRFRALEAKNPSHKYEMGQ